MLVDTRSSQEKLKGWLLEPPIGGLVIAVPGVLGFFFYSHIELWFAFSLMMFFAVRKVHKSTGLIMRLPKSSGLLDPKDPDLGTGKPTKAGGILYMGNDQLTKEEVWLTDTQARTHMMFMGTTGSGKTEYLISLIFNSLVHGSGLIYVDGKADNSLYGKIYSMARSMGREDDVLLINFQTGAKDIYGAQANKLSNTMNPFAVGSSGMLSELIKGLMATGKSDMWSDRAASFVEALIKPLVYLRDNHGLMLDVGVVRSYFELDRLEELAFMKYKDDKPMQESNTLDGLKSYLRSLAGYKEAKYHDQAETVGEQHGYIVMQLTKSFGSLSDTYGYIMKTPLGEIDFVDVFLNRRILIVLLPALEKSPSELTNLGRIVVASIKGTMAKGLGASVEGDWAKIIDSRPTTAPSPFPCVLDEYGYYAVEGFAVVPAQARSLGFSAIFAGQDLPAFEKASKEEAKSTLANTNTKLCGKLECTTTYEYFKSLAGQGFFTRTQRYEQDFGSMFNKVSLDESVSIDRLDRVSANDLRGQSSGYWHMFFGNAIIRLKSFYTNPKKVKKLRVNHFIKVARPSKDEVAAYLNGADFFKRGVESEGGIASFMDRVSSPTDIADIHEAIAHFKDDAPLLMAGKVLAYGAHAELQRSDALDAIGVWGTMEDEEGDQDDAGGSSAAGPSVDNTPVANYIDSDIVSHALHMGRLPTPNSIPPHLAEGASRSDASASNSPLPETLWQPRRNPEDIASSDDGETGTAGQIFSDDAADEFTFKAESFEEMQEAAEAGLTPQRTDLMPRAEEGTHDHSTIYGFESIDDSEAMIGLDEGDAPVDLPPLGDDPDFVIGGSADGPEVMSIDFDEPVATDGLLSRDAVETGLAMVEAKLGSTDAEAGYIGSVVASKLADQTRYLSTPTTKTLDFKEFEAVARSISSSMAGAEQ